MFKYDKFDGLTFVMIWIFSCSPSSSSDKMSYDGTKINICNRSQCPTDNTVEPLCIKSLERLCLGLSFPHASPYMWSYTFERAEHTNYVFTNTLQWLAEGYLIVLVSITEVRRRFGCKFTRVSWIGFEFGRNRYQEEPSWMLAYTENTNGQWKLISHRGVV